VETLGDFRHDVQEGGCCLPFPSAGRLWCLAHRSRSHHVCWFCLFQDLL